MPESCVTTKKKQMYGKNLCGKEQEPDVLQKGALLLRAESMKRFLHLDVWMYSRQWNKETNVRRKLFKETHVL
jgi:hypothetical protein